MSRYARQMILPELGIEGQLMLKQSKVLIIGCGGLGVPAIQYLSAAGVGHITLVDGDEVQLTNLHRQVIYGMSDIGKSKAKVAQAYAKERNSEIEVEAKVEFFCEKNASQLCAGVDVIIDATDNFQSRYVIDAMASEKGIPLVYAAVYQFEGQLSVFHIKRKDGSQGPSLRDFFPEAPKGHSVPDCEAAGVLGTIPGILGTMQAQEALKILLGMEISLDGRMLIIDAKQMTFTTLKLSS